jgi:hypothetical protein
MIMIAPQAGPTSGSARGANGRTNAGSTVLVQEVSVTRFMFRFDGF